MKLTNEQLAELYELAKDGRLQVKFDVLHIPVWAEGPGAEFSIAQELIRLAQPRQGRRERKGDAIARVEGVLIRSKAKPEQGGNR